MDGYWTIFKEMCEVRKCNNVCKILAKIKFIFSLLKVNVVIMFVSNVS